MYKTLKYWKQYKLDKEAKDLQKKISKFYELDKLLTELSKKNGITKY